MVQISESKSEAIVGIDFGTTNSLMVFFDGHETKFFPENGLLKSEIQLSEKHIIKSIKRLMGLNEAKLAELKNYYNFALNNIDIESDGKVYTRTELAAQIFKELMNLSGEKYQKAVITVPAYFDDVARKEIKDAAKLANWEVVRMISEPTAAALAYGFSGQDGLYVIYDLGGGTFDLSLLKMEDNFFRVVKNAGDASFGGDDIDKKIAYYIQNKFVIASTAICKLCSASIP